MKNVTYYNRKETGMCTRCGKHKAVKGRILCQECREKRVKQYSIETNNKQKHNLFTKFIYWILSLLCIGGHVQNDNMESH